MAVWVGASCFFEQLDTRFNNPPIAAYDIAHTAIKFIFDAEDGVRWRVPLLSLFLLPFSRASSPLFLPAAGRAASQSRGAQKGHVRLLQGASGNKGADKSVPVNATPRSTPSSPAGVSLSRDNFPPSLPSLARLRA